MNSTCLIGRLTKDPELRANQSGKNVVRFTLAVNRNFTNANGERETDFISCVAWDKQAENLCKYMKKGNQISVEGRIQTSTYEKEDGTTVYMTDVIAKSIQFLESKGKDERPLPEYNESPKQEENEESDPFAEFGATVEISDDDLPFDTDDNYLE